MGHLPKEQLIVSGDRVAIAEVPKDRRYRKLTFEVSFSVSCRSWLASDRRLVRLSRYHHLIGSPNARGHSSYVPLSKIITNKGSRSRGVFPEKGSIDNGNYHARNNRHSNQITPFPTKSQSYESTNTMKRRARKLRAPLLMSNVLRRAFHPLDLYTHERTTISAFFLIQTLYTLDALEILTGEQVDRGQLERFGLFFTIFMGSFSRCFKAGMNC